MSHFHPQRFGDTFLQGNSIPNGMTPDILRSMYVGSIVLAIVDRILTYMFFAYESNPLVSSLGFWPWLGLTVGMYGGLLIVCESARYKRWEYWCYTGLLCGLNVLYALVTAANIYGIIRYT